ncbi:MAG: hypothetical protein AABZ67_16625 [Pseudomonadota bacterium]
MHDPDGKVVAPGVTRKISDGWAKTHILTGEKDALIASGLVKTEWFWDGLTRDKRGRVRRKKETTVDGQRIVVEARANYPVTVEFHNIAAERAGREALLKEVEVRRAQRDAEAHLLSPEEDIETTQSVIDSLQKHVDSERARIAFVRQMRGVRGDNVIPFPVKYREARDGGYNHDPSSPAA